MRSIFLVAWVTVICISVFTENVKAFLFKGQISFDLNPHPSTDIYFPVYSFLEASTFEMTGHFLMFAVLTYLLVINVQRLDVTFIISLLFAILTELLQPFFGRRADLYDLRCEYYRYLNRYVFLFD
ncbi:hypothetical protein [Radiobacillus sp. PE A8.2]|uniref:hypothetical protein n=1 Tax=Radiobacillus sp. PE A8.2 TaxID=3380349 RepID=UPI00388D0B50